MEFKKRLKNSTFAPVRKLAAADRKDVILAVMFVFMVIGIAYGYTKAPEIVRIEVPVIIKEIEFVELPVIVKEIQVVEVPMVITQTQIETLEVPVIVRSEVEVDVDLRDFESRVDLLAFLINDGTNEIQYTDRFTCMDFTLKIIDNAAKSGYRIVFFYWQKSDNTAHALGMAYVESESQWIVFEPQTDQILWSWTGTRGG